MSKLDSRSIQGFLQHFGGEVPHVEFMKQFRPMIQTQEDGKIFTGLVNKYATVIVKTNKDKTQTKYVRLKGLDKNSVRNSVAESSVSRSSRGSLAQNSKVVVSHNNTSPQRPGNHITDARNRNVGVPKREAPRREAAHLETLSRESLKYEQPRHQEQTREDAETQSSKHYTPGPTPSHKHISPPRRQAPPPPRNNQVTPPKTLKNRTPPTYPANSSNTQHINQNNQIPLNNQSPLNQNVNNQYLNPHHSNHQNTNRNSVNEPLQNHQTNNMSTPKAARKTTLEKSHQPSNINYKSPVLNVNTPEPLNQTTNMQNMNQQQLNQRNYNQQSQNQQKHQMNLKNQQPLAELNISAVQNTPTPVTLSDSPPKSTFKVPTLPKSFTNMSITRDTQSLHSSTPKRITFNTVTNSETSTIGESPYELELPEKQWFQALIVAQSGKTAQMLEQIYMINKENNPYNKLADWQDPLTGYNVLHFAIIRGDSDLLKLATEKFHVRIDTKTSTSGDNALHLAIKSSNLHLIEQVVRCPGGQTLYKSRNDQGLKPIDYMKTYCMPQFLSNNEDFADIKKLLMKGTRAVTGVNQRSFGNDL